MLGRMYCSEAKPRSKTASFGPVAQPIQSYLTTQLLIRRFFSIKKYLYFSYFSTKTYVVGTH